MMIAEPVQNCGGSFVPPPGYWAGLRELCDRYGILLCADEVICAWGRLGAWFGSERIDARPDLITTAKGITSGYFAMGAVVMHDRVAAPVVRDGAMFNHGLTYSGHPVGAAVALKNIEIIEREGLLENVRSNEPWLQKQLDALRTLPIVGDVRGMGYFWAIELVADQKTKATIGERDRDWLLRDFLSARLEERGLIARLDDRDEPVVQLSPPLVADRAVLGQMVDIIGTSLDEAGRALARRGRDAEAVEAAA
jgi:adenosylmethionine-8-amino-7-oxononanoate aminotransferase